MRDENDKLKIDIQRVLQVFTQNESGNKVTQFNMMGLTNMILGVIDGTVVIRQEAPQGPVAPKPIETHRVDLPTPKKIVKEPAELPAAVEQPEVPSLESQPIELGELSDEKPIVTKV